MRVKENETKKEEVSRLSSSVFSVTGKQMDQISFFSSSALVVSLIDRAMISKFFYGLKRKQNWKICAVLSDRLKAGVDVTRLVFILLFF